MVAAKRALVFVAFIAVVAVAAWAIRATPWTTAAQHPASARTEPAQPVSEAVTALGRLEPKDGIIRIAGPSRPAVVIAKLLVEEGQVVEAGDVIAVLDTFAQEEVQVASLQAQLTNALAELERYEHLYRQGTASTSVRDAAHLKAELAKADLQAAQVARDLAQVRAPVRGQVLEIHARAGERVGLEGIAELGQTDQMYAIAEVYETDVRRVRVGQPAIVRSPALAGELRGTVERIGLKIGRLDTVSPDPAADTDARIVDVAVRLADSVHAAGLTNLQVEVSILP